MNKFENELYEKLLDSDLISKEKIDNAVSTAEDKDVSLYEYLTDSGQIEENDLLSATSEITGIEFINLNDINVDEAAIDAVPSKFTWHYKFLPIKLEAKNLTIAVSKPLSINVQDELRLILGFKIVLVLAKKSKVEELLKRYYGLGADTIGKMIERSKDAHGVNSGAKAPVIQDLEKLAGDASVIRLVNQIILEAYKNRATDIHIEPAPGKLRLRYRIDGVLQDQKVPEEVNRFILAILSRIKVMCNLDIIEKRVPQDGRTVVKVQEEVLDLRVSFIPTPAGESVVIRVLPTKMFFNLEKLGLFQKDLDTLKSLIKKPNGIIFVTGPTGSGKTTTLYTCLKEVNRVAKKIITIEDPIEYAINDVIQIQVSGSTGLTFAKGLRSMLRHDPDIMMIGEVRDQETAEIAIRVALTGHLIFSTLHTNDSATGITRLVDIGVKPYLIASSVEAFIAQRLVRTICPDCKEEDTEIAPGIKNDIADIVDMGFDEDVKFFKGKGCEKCNFTGYFGRTAIYEILIVDQDIKELITNGANAMEIKNMAIEKGMKTLLQDGWRKVAKGVTTMSEVMEVCHDIDMKMQRVNKKIEEKVLEKQDNPGTDVLLKNAYPNDRRLYIRIPKKISLQYRIVEKAEGEILKIEKTSSGIQSAESNLLRQGSDNSYKDIFSGEVSAKKLTGKDAETAIKNETFFSSTINISASGIAFESQYSLPVGTVMEININIPWDERNVKCLAKIVRVERNLPRSFNIAATFLDISSLERKIIDDYVKKEFGEHEIIDLNEF